MAIAQLGKYYAIVNYCLHLRALESTISVLLRLLYLFFKINEKDRNRALLRETEILKLVLLLFFNKHF